MVSLSTSSGDGSVQIEVDGSGRIDEAIYDPIGEIGAASTIFDSYVAIRIADSGRRTRLSGGSFDSTSPTSAESEFDFDVLDIDLSQTVEQSFVDGEQSGSLLTQTYTFTNTSDETVSFEAVRYLDGDLAFDSRIQDGGGRITIDGIEVLFETDTAGEPSDSTTFVGIAAEGGTILSSGRYEIDSYSGLQSRILGGTELDDIITGDGDDADEFIDPGNAYDVTLGLNNEFTVAPGESVTYTTSTIFGSGIPEEVELEVNPNPVFNALNPVDAGTEGNDGITGTDADDLIEGFGGNDVIEGKAGDDEIDGGDGIDTAVYQFSPTSVEVALSSTITRDGYGDTDTLINIENVIGSDFADVLAGDDVNNNLTGRDGDDFISGSGGNDFIVGGAGADGLAGGAGADTFLYQFPEEGGDTITDFEVGTDTIMIVGAIFPGDLSGGVPSESIFFEGSAAVDGDDRFGYDASTGDVLFDEDGAGGADAQVLATLLDSPAFTNTDVLVI